MLNTIFRKKKFPKVDKTHVILDISNTLFGLFFRALFCFERERETTLRDARVHEAKADVEDAAFVHANFCWGFGEGGFGARRRRCRQDGEYVWFWRFKEDERHFDDEDEGDRLKL